MVAEEGERARRREVRLGKEVGEDEETGAWEVLSVSVFFIAFLGFVVLYGRGLRIE